MSGGARHRLTRETAPGRMDEDGSARDGLGVVGIGVPPVHEVLLGEAMSTDVPAERAHGLQEVTRRGMIRAAGCRRGGVEADGEEVASREERGVEDEERTEFGRQDDVPLGRRDKARAARRRHARLRGEPPRGRGTGRGAAERSPAFAGRNRRRCRWCADAG